MLFGGLLLVAVILLFEFGDWRAPLLTVVLALTVLTSVLGSLILTGMTLNISSFVGAIMMVGIVGEKAVFLIHDAREELRRGVPVPEAWAEASRKRVRAVMMTIFATAFALAPLAAGARGGLAAPAAPRDRGHRRIHPLEPARPPDSAVSVLLARSARPPGRPARLRQARAGRAAREPVRVVSRRPAGRGPPDTQASADEGVPRPWRNRPAVHVRFTRLSLEWQSCE